MNIDDYSALNEYELNEELLSACLMGELNKVKFILSNNSIKTRVNLNYKDRYGCTALSVAVFYNNKDIIKFLIFDMNRSVSKEELDLIKESNKEDMTMVNLLLELLEKRKFHNNLQNSMPTRLKGNNIKI